MIKIKINSKHFYKNPYWMRIFIMAKQKQADNNILLFIFEYILYYF